MISLLHPGRTYIAVRDAALRAVRRVTLAGDAVHCSVCGTHAARFLGTDVICYACGSRSRQRFLWTYLSPRVRPGDRVLHIAPEPCIARALKCAMADVRSLDLTSPQADVHADLTDRADVMRRVPAHWWQWILCSHVLEHIAEDRAAMATLRSLLAPTGTLIVQIPQRAIPQTDEDPSVTDPMERTRRFGQSDHVRVYGQDFVERLREAGFTVTLGWPSAEEARRQDLDPKDPLFLATTP